jgi:hypothetical protein
MMNSPAYSFIKEYIDMAFQRLEKDKITPWAFFLTDKGLRLTDFFGKPVSYVGVQFEGSPQSVFWSSFIQPFLNDIVSRSFSDTRDFCVDRRLNSKLPLEETAALLKAGIEKAYGRMCDIDQRLRGKGFPKSVPRYTAEKEKIATLEFIETRLAAELASQPRQKRTMSTIYDEQKFWFWLVGIIIAVAGILLKVFV